MTAITKFNKFTIFLIISFHLLILAIIINSVALFDVSLFHPLPIINISSLAIFGTGIYFRASYIVHSAHLFHNIMMSLRCT